MSFCEEMLKPGFFTFCLSCDAPVRKINCVFSVNNVWSGLRSGEFTFFPDYSVLLRWKMASVSNDTRPLGELREAIIYDCEPS